MTREEAATASRQAVLQTIVEHEPISRADVARATRLTRGTVSAIVADLLKKGWVIELGLGETNGGKPPTMLGFDGDKARVVAIDLSQRPFLGSLLDLRGGVIRTERGDDPDAVGDEALADLDGLVERLLASPGRVVLGIGIGTPGVVDDEGVVINAANLGWHDVKLGRHLSDRFGLPVHVTNDADAAALAEYARLDPGSVRNLIAIRIGEGVGAGIILDGRPFRGEGHAAGELGHVRVGDSDIECRCGNRGCLETVAALPRLRTQEASASQPETGGGAVFDPRAVEAAGTSLGRVIAAMVGILDVHRIVIGGEIIGAGAAFLAAVRAEVAQSVLTPIAPTLDIVYSELDSRSVILGSVALVVRQELGVVSQ